jgi:predicted transcriptional regulator
MEHQDQEQQQMIQWRRDKVQELYSKGYSQREISHTLQIGLATVNRDISYLRNQANENIKRKTNATVIDDAIRFVSSNKTKEELKSASNCRSEDNSESKEPDYDEDKDQLEEEKQEEETGKITSATTNNQIF